jgi:hypothetical protein
MCSRRRRLEDQKDEAGRLQSCGTVGMTGKDVRSAQNPNSNSTRVQPRLGSEPRGECKITGKSYASSKSIPERQATRALAVGLVTR